MFCSERLTSASLGSPIPLPVPAWQRHQGLLRSNSLLFIELLETQGYKVTLETRVITQPGSG